MTKEERILLTNDLLSRFPAHGEFEMQYINAGQVITASPYNDLLRRTQEAIEGAKLIQQTYLNETEIIQDLIFGGFIINRHDIKTEGKIYRQLTDRGRELKELGSMEAFKLHVANDNRKKMLQDQRINRLYWINFWIMVGALGALVYYILEILRIQYHRGLPFHVFFQ